LKKLCIEGGIPLTGKINVSGSKNAALPILFASLMCEGQTILNNIPRLRDVYTTLTLLRCLGCEAEFENNQLCVVPKEVKIEAPYDLVKTMRASILCLGPLLAVAGKAKVALPGGCAIGARPVDLHLKGLAKMGANFELDQGYIWGECKRLKGAYIHFDFPTVGGTENILMAACLAEGETVIENAAKEPEVVDLANFLNQAGAKISGQGTSVIRVQGVSKLTGCEYTVMPDRIEAGTYIIAGIITQGNLEVVNCPCKELDAVLDKLLEMGANLKINKSQNKIQIRPNQAALTGVDVITAPYPGFPTDMQAQIMALLCLARGSGIIKETIFENRFMHVLELIRLGADIKLSHDTAVVRGVKQLIGAPVMASDLRASASLVIAGLAAKGVTEISRIYHLERGYEKIEEKLRAVGAKVWTTK